MCCTHQTSEVCGIYDFPNTNRELQTNSNDNNNNNNCYLIKTVCAYAVGENARYSRSVRSYSSYRGIYFPFECTIFSFGIVIIGHDKPFFLIKLFNYHYSYTCNRALLNVFIFYETETTKSCTRLLLN